MPITPEQARAELQRRATEELWRRSQTLSPIASPEMLSAAGKVMEDQRVSELTPEPQPGLFREAGRAIVRGGIKTAASVPGTLAAVMKAGSNAPYQWAPRIPEVEAQTQQDIQKLKQKARSLYKLAGSERYAARRGGAAGFTVNLLGETAPQMGASVVAGLLGGPAAVVVTSAITGGEEVRQNLLDLGVSEDKADAAAWVTAPIIGLLEKWQVDEVLKVKKPAAIRSLVQAAREKSLRKLANAGRKVTFNEAMSATAEGLQEALQEVTGVGAEIVLARDFDPSADLTRIATAFGGGALAGEAFRGIGGGIRAVGGIDKTLKKRGLDKLVEARNALEAETVKPFAPEETQTSSAAAGIVTKPRMRIVGEPGTETPAAEVTPKAKQSPSSQTSSAAAGVVVKPRMRIVGEPGTETPAAEVPPRGNQPWEMTREEFRDTIIPSSKKGPEYDYEAVMEARIPMIERVGEKVIKETGTDVPEYVAEYYAKKYGIDIPVQYVHNEPDFPFMATEINPSTKKPTIYIGLRAIAGASDKTIIGAMRHEIEHVRDMLAGFKGTERIQTNAIITDISGETPAGKFIKRAKGHHKQYDLFETDYLHRSAVKLAFKQGLPVPRAVLEDYKGEPWADAALAKVETLAPVVVPVEAKQSPSSQTSSAAAGVVVKPRMRIVGEPGTETSIETQKPTGSAPQPPLPPPGEQQPPLPPISEPSTPAPGEPFSARNAAVAQVRTKLGLSDIPRREPETIAQWRQEAIEQGIPDRALEIANEIILNPRPMTPQETQGFEIAARDVEAKYDSLAQHMDKAAPGSTEAKQIANAMKIRQQEYDNISKAIDYAGTPEGRSFRARQATKTAMQDDTSVLSTTRRAEATKGDRLAPEERADVETKTRALKDAVGRARTVKRSATRRSIRRIGKLRYKGMTDAEKDAEIADILTRPLEDKAIKQIAENIASRDGIGDFDAVVKRMQDFVPDVTVESVSDSIVAASTRQARVTDGLLLKLREIMGQARRNEQLRLDVKDLEYYLDERLAPEPRERTIKTETEANQKLLGIREQLRQQLRESDPVQAQKLQQQIDYLTNRLEAGDCAPKIRAEKPIRSAEIEKLDYEVYKLRSELGRRIAQLAPKSKMWYITEPFRAMQALKSSMDVSAVLRQAGIAVRSAPIRSFKRLPEMFRAMMDPQKAFAIQQEIDNRSNAWLYHRAGLDFTRFDGMGPLTAFEEAFQSDLASRIPVLGRGVRASNRAFATFLNLVRADSFDVMSEAFTKRGSHSLLESKAIANYINVMTGRGNFAGIEKWGPALNGWLWSPRYTVSRIQFLVGQPFKGGTWRTRRIIANEYAKYLAGVWVTQMLYEQIFGGKVSRDPLSTDYGKMVVGNTRLDPLSGLSQTTVLLAREIMGKKTTGTGNVVPIRGAERPYGGATMLTTLGRWTWGKLGFLPGKAVDIGMGTNVVGEPVTPKSFALSMIPIPLGWQDVYNVMVDQGVPKGAALEVLSLFGEGLQVYETDTGGEGPRKIKQRKIAKRKL